MIPVFPKSISDKGIEVYILCLILVSVAFFSHVMSFMWMILGITEVSMFFGLSSKFTKEWQHRPQKDFAKKIFWTAVLIRIVWVVFSYFFYQIKTGQPFEFGAADAIGYHEEAKEFSSYNWNIISEYFFNRSEISDVGYPLYLTCLYKLFGPIVIVPRFIKAFLSAFSAVLIYKLASRSCDEFVGRMAGIFFMLMPNFIVYCGLHVKETEMIFIIVAFLERSDYVLRNAKVRVFDIIISLLLAALMFTFRTVLGVVALFSFVTALVFSPSRKMKKGRKVIVGFWVLLSVIVLAGGTVMNEIQELWMNKDSNQELKRQEQTSRGNQWAKYATGTVMAPMIFVLPFSTMVDTGQENQIVIHGGNYVRNFMGAFVLLALFISLFKKKTWRNFALIGSFVVGYLGVISLSGFANSERFLLPGLPCLIIMWAYGISELTPKSFKFVKYWYVIVPIMEIGWAFFKIGSRGQLG